MAIWQYTVYLLPEEYIGTLKSVDVDVIDNFPGWVGLDVLKRTGWLKDAFGFEQMLYGACSFGKPDESCAYLIFDEQAGLVTEISFRLDLRSKIGSALAAICRVGSELNALIVTQDLKLVSPFDIEKFKAAILASDAAKFVTDPLMFLEGLE